MPRLGHCDYIDVYTVVKGTVSISKPGTDAPFLHFLKRDSNNNWTRDRQSSSKN